MQKKLRYFVVYQIYDIALIWGFVYSLLLIAWLGYTTYLIIANHITDIYQGINLLLLTKYPKQIFLISILPSFLLLSRYIIIKFFGKKWIEYFHYQIEFLIENIPEHKNYLSNFIGKDIPPNEIPKVLKNIQAWINLQKKLLSVGKRITKLSEIRTKAEENVKLPDIRPKKSIVIDQSILIFSSVVVILTIAIMLALVYQAKIQHREIATYFSSIILLISLIAITIGVANNWKNQYELQYELTNRVENIQNQLQELWFLKQQIIKQIILLEDF